MNKEKIAIYEELIEFADARNKIYPSEVFPEPWDGWQKDIDELAKTKGFRLDSISAHYSRWKEKQMSEDLISHLKGRIEELNKDENR